MAANAKVFWSGRSQAVRLPLEFRFEASELRIRRQGASVILEPVPRDWSWLDSLGALDPDAADAALEPQNGQSRPGLDDLFG